MAGIAIVPAESSDTSGTQHRGYPAARRWSRSTV